MIEMRKIGQHLESLEWISKPSNTYRYCRDSVSTWIPKTSPANGPTYVLTIFLQTCEPFYNADLSTTVSHVNSTGDTFSTKTGKIWVKSTSSMNELLASLEEFTKTVCSSTEALESFTALQTMEENMYSLYPNLDY